MHDLSSNFSAWRRFLVDVLLREVPIRVAVPAATMQHPSVDITPCQWAEWPAWLNAPYEEQGEPPGEKRVAELIGGHQTRSKSVPFDVSVETGKYAGVWEVKAPDRSNTIRCGTDSVAATERFRAEVTAAARFVKSIEGIPFVERAGLEGVVSSFLRDEKMGYSSVMKGNVSPGTLTKLEDILKGVKRAAMATGAVPGSSAVLGISTTTGDVSAEVSYTMALRVARLADLEVPGLCRDSGEDLLSRLEEAVPRPVEGWASEVRAFVQTDKCFHPMDAGIFLVKPDGFLLVPKSDIGKKFEFARTSNGRAHLKFVG